MVNSICNRNGCMETFSSFFKAFQMDYDPHLEDDQLETQQTKEILETELTKVSNNR